VEVPITVTPFIRIPFYGTFHLLSGKQIFDLGYYLLQKTGMNINYEVHAIVDAGFSGDWPGYLSG